ncbi:hypothetical protein CU044_6821 [Streptomyces sp. L-9-10]|nr:hypothetical protein CU044_6821 [Streptomyces sp. L-9-10]
MANAVPAADRITCNEEEVMRLRAYGRIHSSQSRLHTLSITGISNSLVSCGR